MIGDRQAPARNMSAPPSTTLTFAALAPESGATGDAVADGTGLAFVCRLDFSGLLPACYWKAVARNDVVQARSPEDCVRIAYPYVRAEAGRRERPTRAAYAHAKAAPVEALADELRDLIAAESLAGAGLPAVGLFLPANTGQRVPLAGLARTLAILARRRGTLFLRDADPIVWTAVDGGPLDLWTPAPVRGGMK